MAQALRLETSVDRVGAPWLHFPGRVSYAPLLPKGGPVSEMAAEGERGVDRFALGALVAGGAALVIFIIASFTSDVLWPIGIVLAVVGAVLGWLALRRTRRGERSRTIAIGGLAASAIVLAWFVIFLIVSAFD